MTACCIDLPRVIPLHRPWWRRWLDLAARPRRLRLVPASEPARWNERDLRHLRHLSARTLRDIGAPEWVADERDAADRLRLELMRQ